MQSRALRVTRSVFLSLSLALVSGWAFADAAFNSITATPSPVQAGFTIDVQVSANITDDNSDGDGNQNDADWQSVWIALTNGVDTFELYCANLSDADDISNTSTSPAVRNFNDLAIPIYLPADTYDVVVRIYDAEGECGTVPDVDGGGEGPNDDAENSTLEDVEVTATSVTLDGVLCIDASTSINATEFQLQLDGTSTGINVALNPDSLDGSVRLTTIFFGTGITAGPGPTIIDSLATLDAYRAALEASPQPGGSTNTSGCMSAALDVMCGESACPDDGIRRVVDVSTDGNPTVNDCGTDTDGGASSSAGDLACTIQRAGELEAAGVSTLNVIGVGDGISQANMVSWVFPLPADVYDASAGEAPGPDDEGFVIIVEDFTDYEPAILAKIGAELLEGNFIVSKTYSDGTTTDPVDITLTCTGATIVADNPLQAAPGAPAIFNVSGHTGTDTCTAVESNGPPGWTADNTNCVDVGIVDVGTCSISNTLNTSTFTVAKDFSDDNTDSVSVSLSCDSGTVVESPLDASEAAAAVFTVEGFVDGATCTATEVAPAGYTPDESGCEDVGLADPGSCTIVNTLNTGGFTVNKTYDDATVTGVTVNLTCSDGVVTTNGLTAAPGAPAIFEVTGWTTAPTCTALESGVPAGYTADNTDCQDDDPLDGSCTIANTLNTGGFTVNKTYDDATVTGVTVNLTCSDGVVTTNGLTAAPGAPAIFEVTGWTTAPTCTALESGVPAGYTADNTDCQDDDPLDGSCTIANTLNTGGFTVNKTYDDATVTGVTVNLTCSDGVVTTNGLTAAPGAPAIFEVTGWTTAPTCTALESGVPAGYTADNTDCQDDDPLDGSCTIANTLNTGNFTVNKTYDDATVTGVTVNLTCSDGVVTTNGLTAAPGAPAIFEVTGWTTAPTCTALESGVPAGYTADNTDCQDDDPLDGSCTIVNTFDGAPDINLAKTVNGPAALQGNGSYTVVYTVTATNNGDTAGTYNLVDTFSPGAGITLNTATAQYVAGTENSQTGTPGAYPNFVTGEGLAAGLNESWTITANFAVNPAQVSPNSSQCDPGEPAINTGFYNAVSGVDQETDTTDNDTCTDLPDPNIDLIKALNVAAVLQPNGSYTVTYLIHVINNGDGPGFYDLVDAFSPGAGITLASATAQYTAGTENSQTGTTGAYPNFVTGEALAADRDEFWNVTANFTVNPTLVSPNSSQCDNAAPVINTGFYNAITGVVGEGDTTNNDACTSLPPPNINLAKTVNGPAALQPDTTFTVVYTITATNNGTGPGLYDLVDAFSPAVGITLNNATALYVAGTENSQTGTLGAYPNFVTGEALAGSRSESWTVTANFTVVLADLDPATVACSAASPVINTGFYNAVTGVVNEEDTTDNATCASLEPPARRTTFRVIKDFTDDNPAHVEVEISCFTGLPLIQNQEIWEGRDVVFIVESFDPGELDCDVSELIPEGYSPTYDGSIVDGEADEPTEDELGCHFDNVVAGEFLCSIVNTPDPVDVVIEKVWILEGAGGHEVDTEYELELFCDAEIVSGNQYCGNAYAESPSGDNGLWCRTFEGDGSAIFIGQVIPEYPDSHCWVQETVYDDSVEIDNDCGLFVVSAGHGASCVVTNTVFFEGIPTLNQYGVAILALLMMGIGLVGFRRFV